jgi:ATP-dependent Lon protease
MAINRRKFLRASGGAAALAASGTLGGALAAAPDAAKERPVNLAALPKELPLVPVRDKVYFPRMTSLLFVGRDRTVAAVDAAEGRGGYLFITAQKETTVDAPRPDDLYPVGVIARVQESTRLPDGTLRVTLEGLARARVQRFLDTEAYLEVRVEPIAETPATAEADRALAAELWSQRQKRLEGIVPREDLGKLAGIDDPGRLADAIAPYLEITVAEQQAILETAAPGERLKRVTGYFAGAPAK